MKNELQSRTLKTRSRSHIFAQTLKKRLLPLYFNDSFVKETCKQKHLGILLDFSLDFQEHWKFLLKKSK